MHCSSVAWIKRCNHFSLEPTIRNATNFLTCADFPSKYQNVTAPYGDHKVLAVGTL